MAPRFMAQLAEPVPRFKQGNLVIILEGGLAQPGGSPRFLARCHGQRASSFSRSPESETAFASNATQSPTSREIVEASKRSSL